jgi:hypothetical protein
VVLDSDALRVFENIAELYIFMEGFKTEEYLSVHPRSSDIMTDMTVMHTWIRSLEGFVPVMRQELIRFDFDAMATQMLAVARTATRSFMRLVHESMYDKCMELLVRPMYLFTPHMQTWSLRDVHPDAMLRPFPDLCQCSYENA